MEVGGQCALDVENEPSCNLKALHSNERIETLIYLLDRHVTTWNPERVHGEQQA